jgi:hypothetical protein
MGANERRVGGVIMRGNEGGGLCSRNSLPGQWNVMTSLSTIRGAHYNAPTWTVDAECHRMRNIRTFENERS